jgi:hypothetical protein
MPRWVYLLGLGLGLLALGLAFTDWLLSLRPGVTEANARRIKQGMTLIEVEAVLGSPTGIRDPTLEFHWPPSGPAVCWETKNFGIYVWFDECGKARGIMLSRTLVEPAQDSPLARLRAWLGW